MASLIFSGVNCSAKLKLVVIIALKFFQSLIAFIASVSTSLGSVMDGGLAGTGFACAVSGIFELAVGFLTPVEPCDFFGLSPPRMSGA